MERLYSCNDILKKPTPEKRERFSFVPDVRKLFFSVNEKTVFKSVVFSATAGIFCFIDPKSNFIRMYFFTHTITAIFFSDD